MPQTALNNKAGRRNAIQKQAQYDNNESFSSGQIFCNGK